MTLLLSLHRFGDTFLNQSAVTTLGEVLCVSMSSQAEMFKHILRRLLADQRLSRLVVVEREECAQSLLESYQEELQVSGEKMASRARQSLTCGTSTSISTRDKVEGLDVTLDDTAGFTDESWWMIGCRCVINE